MYDVCQVFKELQQNFQRSRLILLEVITARETALRKLNLMKQGPIAGGMEEKYSINEIDDNESRGRRLRHYSAIRSQVIMSAVNFLGDKDPQRILKGSSPKEIIDASRELVCDLFGEEKLREFTSDVCKSFAQIENIQNIESSDQGTVLTVRLRKMIQVSQGLLKTLLASFLAVTPHSMATERVVSHYNRVKTEDKACLKQTTINNVLQISLNGKGTVLFDPREAVAEFLKRKSRRNSQPDTELFKDRVYMRTFYRESSGCL